MNILGSEAPFPACPNSLVSLKFTLSPRCPGLFLSSCYRRGVADDDDGDDNFPFEVVSLFVMTKILLVLVVVVVVGLAQSFSLKLVSLRW